MSNKTREHHHFESDKKGIISRLSRIEGQVRGISKMVQEGVYCQDVLNQFASVKSALNGARDIILQEHIKHCIAKKMAQDKVAATEELMSIIKKISK